MSTIQVEVTQRFAAPPESVMNAWLDADQVRQWFPAALQRIGLTGEIARIELDPRVGGSFRFCDVRGGVEECHWGTYLELEWPRKIVFTWNTDESGESDPINIDLTFEPEGDGCVARLITEMDAKWVTHIGKTKRGWGGMLEATAALLDGQSREGATNDS